MMRFADKVCLVTGGASGIGRASCERFAAEALAKDLADLDFQFSLKTLYE